MTSKVLYIFGLSFLSSHVFAAAFDRTGQSISAFLQPGNYFEAGLTISDSTVEGKESGKLDTTRDIPNSSNTTYRPNAALKLQINPKVSLGLIYDQPFSSDATYNGTNNFVSASNDKVLIPGYSVANLASATGQNEPTGGSLYNIDIQNLSFILGYQPNNRWNFYAGPSYESFQSNIHLRGRAFSVWNGYNFDSKVTEDWGWLAGFAFQIPEKALKLSLTYRSEITHKVQGTETAPIIDMLMSQSGKDSVNQYLQSINASTTYTTQIDNVLNQLSNVTSTGTTKFTVPDSLNLEFQKGLTKSNMLFGNVRWVNWSTFTWRPYLFGETSQVIGQLANRPDGYVLIHYYKDSWTANLGLGHKFNPKWSGFSSIGWDSGAGGGAVEGYYNVGLGLQYSPTPKYFISSGMKYSWFNDSESKYKGLTSDIANYKNNYGLAYSLKIGYRF